MTADATSQLIQRIKNQTPQANWSTQQNTVSFIAQLDNLVGTAANYAQILSTVEGPIAQAAAVPTVAAIAAQAVVATAAVSGPAATAEANALTTAAQAAIAGDAAGAAAAAGAVSAGVGAAIVLIVSFVLAEIGASTQSGSPESQELAQLATAIQDIENITLANYWQQKWTSIFSFWNSATGGLGTDLDNIAAEGTGGTDVKNDVAKFHDNAMAFVNNLVPSETPGAGVYWERPNLQELVFSPQLIPYPSAFIGVTVGWYGKLPQSAPSQYDSGMVADPRTALPYLLLGIKSYLTIEMLVNIIDPSQPTFTQFLKQFQNDLVQYGDFLYWQFTLAVNGLVKSDVPSFADVMGFLRLGNFIESVNAGAITASNTQNNLSMAPAAGFAWNGVYGVVNEYPEYGAYQPPPPVAVPSAAPSYILDIVTPYNFSISALYASPVSVVSEQVEASVQAIGPYALQQVVYPWVNCKITLGLMARWKALYLINGYDKVWPIIQNLCVLAGGSPTGQPSNYSVTLPDKTIVKEPTLPDGTKANGNWSSRELINVLSASHAGAPGFAAQFAPLLGPPYSLLGLVSTLDQIANGNWTMGWMVANSTPLRPISFRARLAAAAV